MTVRELVELLQTFPQSLPVQVTWEGTVHNVNKFLVCVDPDEHTVIIDADDGWTVRKVLGLRRDGSITDEELLSAIEAGKKKAIESGE